MDDRLSLVVLLLALVLTVLRVRVSGAGGGGGAGRRVGGPAAATIVVRCEVTLIKLGRGGNLFFFVCVGKPMFYRYKVSWICIHNMVLIYRPAKAPRPHRDIVIRDE